MAAQLMGHGITQVRPLLGGLDAWADAGLPLASHEEPAPLTRRGSE